MIDLLYSALRAPCGLALSAPDQAAGIQALYAARRSANDPQLAALSIHKAPDGSGQIWVTHKASAPEIGI